MKDFEIGYARTLKTTRYDTPWKLMRGIKIVKTVAITLLTTTSFVMSIKCSTSTRTGTRKHEWTVHQSHEGQKRVEVNGCLRPGRYGTVSGKLAKGNKNYDTKRPT
ncbi:hypothetical protein E2C01_051787 [Portunus trituberculatus]|uniref:Uncharacterized protein n=1 Tax=Portunus trituberculatus TaxID=210409 RepID=A0A5B7GJR2_PORTR|nr:hypothetical protein [Portunus trituberculatus]